MRGDNPLAALVAPEVIARAAAVELPAFAALRLTPPPVEASAPASGADENYRLIPLG